MKYVKTYLLYVENKCVAEGTETEMLQQGALADADYRVIEKIKPKKEKVKPEPSFLHGFKVCLMRDGFVDVSGLGTFRVKRMPARKGFNPMLGGKSYRIEAKNKIVFIPTKKLKDKLSTWQSK